MGIQESSQTNSPQKAPHLLVPVQVLRGSLMRLVGFSPEEADVV